MRVAVVAGPDPGHAFPAIALCLRFRERGDEPTLYTGTRWLDAAEAAGIPARLLQGLAPRPVDDDGDAGRRIHERAAYIATLLAPDLDALAPDLVVSDILTAGGGLAADLRGTPWVELSPHPLYAASKGLPPIGSGLAPGVGVRGRVRDTVLRRLTARSIEQGLRQRSEARVGIGLPARDPGPVARLIATLPALEVARPDWPAEAHVVGPLHWEPTDAVLEPPPGDAPLVDRGPVDRVHRCGGNGGDGARRAGRRGRAGGGVDDRRAAGRPARLGERRPRPPGSAAARRRRPWSAAAGTDCCPRPCFPGFRW